MDTNRTWGFLDLLFFWLMGVLRSWCCSQSNSEWKSHQEPDWSLRLIPSGKLTITSVTMENQLKSSFLMGKLTINGKFVKLPEGSWWCVYWILHNQGKYEEILEAVRFCSYPEFAWKWHQQNILKRTRKWTSRHMGLSENSVPLHPMVNDHYPFQ